MKITIPKLVVITRTRGDGRQVHIPFLSVVEDIDAQSSDDMKRKLIPLGTLDKGYEMTLEQIVPAAKNYFLKRLDEGDILYHYRFGPYHLNYTLNYGNAQDEEHAFLIKGESIREDEVEYLVYQLVGEGLKKRVGFENWTQEGYPLRCNIPKGGKTVQRRIFTYDDFLDLLKILRKGNGITDDPFFDFSNKIGFEHTGDSLYEKKSMMEVMASEYYVIDAFPEAKDGERKYMAAPKIFIQKAITTEFQEHAMKFATEDEALTMALKSVDTFEQGGFEIRKMNSLNGQSILYRIGHNKKCYWL